MTDDPKQPSTPLSLCHNAPVKLVGGRGDFSDHEEGITMHYECTAEGCGLPCDLAVESQPQPAESGELHMALLAWKNGDITMIELKKYLDTHLRAELQALRERMPEKRKVNEHHAYADLNEATVYVIDSSFNEGIDQALAALDEVISKYGSEGA